MICRNISLVCCICLAVVIANVYSEPDLSTGSDLNDKVNRLATNNPTKELAELLDGGEGAMVTVVAGGTRLAVHRAVLAARGPAIAAMLEESDGRVVLPDLEESVLRQLLAFLYTVEEAQDPSVTSQLWTATDRQGRPVPKAECRQRAATPLSVETAAATAVVAVRHSCTSLRQAAVSFIRAHMQQVIASPGWADAVHNWHKEVTEVTRLLFDAPAETCSPATGDRRTSPTTQPPSHHTDHDQTPSTAASSVTCGAFPPPDSAAIAALRRLSREEKASRLIAAAKEGAVEEVAALLSAGAGVGARDEDGMTALHWVAAKGHLEVARCLLGAGADVEARNSGKSTPLLTATGNGRTSMVRLLLAASADPNVRKEDGWTPLHWAAGWGRTEAAAALLEAGADRGARDNKGRTPLDIARKSNNQKIVDLLS